MVNIFFIILGSYQGIPIKINKDRVGDISDTTRILEEIIKKDMKLGRNTLSGRIKDEADIRCMFF